MRHGDFFNAFIVKRICRCIEFRRGIGLVQHRDEVIGGHDGVAQGHVKALFMTVWRPRTRSAENSCGIRQG